MNIISSNCLGGRFHQLLNVEFSNPFMWSSIYLSDFVELIKSSDTINLKNIEMSYSQNNFGREKCTKLSLDDTINVYFSHHIYNENEKTPKRCGDVNIEYDNILEYVKNKWLNRVGRTQLEPVFVYDDIKEYTDIAVENFISVTTPYKKLLITTNKSLIKYESDNLKVYIKPANNYHTFNLANDILNNDDYRKYLGIYYAIVLPSSQFCNILFQYAAAKYYAKENNFIPCFSMEKIYMLGIDKFNDYKLHTFLKHVRCIKNLPKNIVKFHCDSNHLFQEIPVVKEDILIDGLLQSPKYFGNSRNWIKEVYKPSEGLINEIKSLYPLDFEEYVSIHIRRKDFLRYNRFRKITPDYIQYIMHNFFSKDQKFIILSDDIEWCKKNLNFHNCIFSDKKSNKYPQYLIDLYVQTLCKDNIIHPGSTFSWWGAYLNIHSKRRVYYSSPWFETKEDDKTKLTDEVYDVIPDNDNWIDINKL